MQGLEALGAVEGRGLLWVALAADLNGPGRCCTAWADGCLALRASACTQHNPHHTSGERHSLNTGAHPQQSSAFTACPASLATGGERGRMSQASRINIAYLAGAPFERWSLLPWLAGRLGPPAAALALLAPALAAPPECSIFWELSNCWQANKKLDRSPTPSCTNRVARAELGLSVLHL